MAEQHYVGNESAYGDALAVETIGENEAVTWSATAKKIRVCDAGDRPIGVAPWGGATGDNVKYHWGKQGLGKGGGVFAAGDKLKMANGGKFVADGTTGSTANSVDTVAIAITACAADGDKFQYEWGY